MNFAEKRFAEYKHKGQAPQRTIKMGGKEYLVNFEQMTQKAPSGGISKIRRIRHASEQVQQSIRPVAPPPEMQYHSFKPGMAMMAVTVPPTWQPGTVLDIPHPQNPSVPMKVQVPAGAGPGTTIQIPVPPVPAELPPSAPSESELAAMPEEEKKKKGWGLGTKMGLGMIGAAGIGVAAVVIADEAGADWAGDVIQVSGDVAVDVGEAVADAWNDLQAAI